MNIKDRMVSRWEKEIGWKLDHINNKQGNIDSLQQELTDFKVGNKVYCYLASTVYSDLFSHCERKPLTSSRTSCMSACFIIKYIQMILRRLYEFCSLTCV